MNGKEEIPALGGAEAEAPPPRRPVRNILVLIAFGAILLVPSMFTRDLWGSDEHRYMEVAREMAATNDYVTAHLNGSLYANKPPLFFWLTAGLYKAGAGTVSGRLVSAFAAVGLLLLVYLFGRILGLPSWGPLLAALATASTILFADISSMGVTDSLLTLCTTTSFMGAYMALKGNGKRCAPWWLLFYGSCGLAVLTKGPVGFLVPAIAVAIFALSSRKQIRAGGWAHAWGAMLFVGIVAAWLGPTIMRGGKEYAWDLIVGQQEVYTTKTVGHEEPFYFYFKQLGVFFYPWVTFGALWIAKELRDWRKQEDLNARFLTLWFLGTLIFFSLFPAKRMRYLMPMTPALGLLCAQYFVSGVREGFPWPRLHKTAVAIAFLPLLLGGIALAAFPWYADRWAAKTYESEPALRAGILALFTPLAVAVIVAVAVSIVASVIIAWRLNTRKRAPLPLAFIVLLFTLVAAFLIFPLINPDKSFRNFCAKMLPYLEKADKIYLYNDNFDGAINLFTGINRFPILRSEGRKGDPGELARIMQGPAKVAIIAEEKEISPELGRLSGAKVLVRHSLQKHRLVLVGNWEESEKESGRFETKTLPTASKPSSLIIPN